jgi:hypothetical protein
MEQTPEITQKQQVMLNLLVRDLSKKLVKDNVRTIRKEFN